MLWRIKKAVSQNNCLCHCIIGSNESRLYNDESLLPARFMHWCINRCDQCSCVGENRGLYSCPPYLAVTSYLHLPEFFIFWVSMTKSIAPHQILLLKCMAWKGKLIDQTAEEHSNSATKRMLRARRNLWTSFGWSLVIMVISWCASCGCEPNHACVMKCSIMVVVYCYWYR